MTAADVAIVTFNVPPCLPASLKYTRLGLLGVGAARNYAARHGYAFYDSVPEVGVRPACWGKIPALLDALDRHAWAVWIDSDAVARPVAQSLAPLLNTDAELVAEDPDPFFTRLGVAPALGRASQPLHSAVFAVRAGNWSRTLLKEAWGRSEVVKPREPWDGIGEQEALNAVLKRRPPQDRARIAYVTGLQAPPALVGASTRFVHFYGDRTEPLFAPDACGRVLDEYRDALAGARTPDRPLELIHWCAIQALGAKAHPRRGPGAFGYDPAALRAAASAPQPVP